MDDRKFDELLGKALKQRCSGQLPDGLIRRVTIRVGHKDDVIIHRLEMTTVAAVVASIVVTALISLFVVKSQNYGNHDAPPFYVDAYDVTKSRLDESSSVSIKLRDDINELYSDIQP